MKKPICSLKKMYFGTSISYVLLALLWVLTHNLIVAAIGFFVITISMLLFVHRDSTVILKGLTVILVVLLFFVGSKYAITPEKDKPNTVIETGEVSKQDDTKTEETPKEEEKEEKKPKVEKQKVTYKNKNKKKNYAKSPLSEIMGITFNTAGGGVAGGDNSQVVVQGSEVSDIIYKDDTSTDGIKTDVNNNPIPPSSETPKDESTRVDLSDKNNNIKDTPTTEQNTPAPLPEEEQLKQDVKDETTDKELEDMLNNTKPSIQVPVEPPIVPDNSSDTSNTIPNNSDDATNTVPDSSNTTDTTPDNSGDTTNAVPDNSTSNPQEGEDNSQNSNSSQTGENEQTPPTSDNSTSENGNVTDTKDEKPADTTSNTNNSQNNVKPAPQEPAKEPTPAPAEPAKPVATPVSVEVIGNPSITAGETVQFKVSGDYTTIGGLDGLNHSNVNGIITINTEPSVATVITVTANGVDGSSASASVNVNVLN